MLGLQHKIVLEDHTGEKHTLHLLEIIADQYFVLLPPAEAAELQSLQEGGEAIADDAVEILVDSLCIISVRNHRFLDPDQLPSILAQSRHHILRLCGLRLDAEALPPADRIGGDALARAFAEECRLRQSW
jgi:hypothetical protein